MGAIAMTIEFTNGGRAKTGICDYCVSFECEGNTVTIINEEFICEACLIKKPTEEEVKEMWEA